MPVLSKQKCTGPPTPHELTRDPDWDEDEKMLTTYDLGLDNRSSVKVFIGIDKPDLHKLPFL